MAGKIALAVLTLSVLAVNSRVASATQYSALSPVEVTAITSPATDQQKCAPRNGGTIPLSATAADTDGQKEDCATEWTPVADSVTITWTCSPAGPNDPLGAIIGSTWTSPNAPGANVITATGHDVHNPIPPKSDDMEENDQEHHNIKTVTVWSVGLTSGLSYNVYDPNMNFLYPGTVQDGNSIEVFRGAKIQFSAAKLPEDAPSWPANKPYWEHGSFFTCNETTPPNEPLEVTAECGSTITVHIIVLEPTIGSLEYFSPAHNDWWPIIEDHPACFMVGTTVQFRAVPDPDWSGWSDGLPVWYDPDNPEGVEAMGTGFGEASYWEATFETVSTSAEV
jgi:hypothetical protein